MSHFRQWTSIIILVLVTGGSCSAYAGASESPGGPAELAGAPGKRSIAIAPPQNDLEILSDELGEKLEVLVQKHYPSDAVLPFRQTFRVFESYSYNYFNIVRDLYRKNLYQDLKASHILETQTEEKKNGILLHSELIEINTGKKVDSFSEMIPYAELKAPSRSPLFKKLSSLVSLVPNTVFLDITSSQLGFWTGGGNSVSPYIPVSDSNFSAFQILTAIALRNTRSPKFDQFKGVFRIMPDINFYYDRFHFTRNDQPNALAGMSFSWSSLSLGIGAQAGLESPFGYFYFELVPSLAMNWISSPNSQVNQLTPEVNAEIGYSIFVSQRVTLRLFSRAITGSVNQWSSILSTAAGQPIQLQYVSHGIFGLAVGYYFPESRSIVKEIFH